MQSTDRCLAQLGIAQDTMDERCRSVEASLQLIKSVRNLFKTTF